MPRPDVRPAKPKAPGDPGMASRKLSAHYGRLQQDLLARGLLRTDGGGPDTPFSDRDLAENFVRIALFDEYITRGGRLVAKPTPANLRRWDGPVRFGVQFGATVPEAQRSKDRALIGAYVKRLARITGHPITQSSQDANFHVLILNEGDRRAIGPKLRALVPGISDTSVRTVETLPRSILCLVMAFSVGENNFGYTKAVAIVRGEHPDLMRQSCVHEELAQGLGLANDSPEARPSVFNDDEEFGLLTNHDELLLRMLYDRRLQTGMNATSARPTINLIASELMAGNT